MATEKKGSEGDFDAVMADRLDVITRSEDFFSYETPFIDPVRAAVHKMAFTGVPSNVFPHPRPAIVEMWNQMYPFALEYVVHEDNGMFCPCDSAILHAFVRHTKPRRVFEVGSGFSTRVVKAALYKNA